MKSKPVQVSTPILAALLLGEASATLSATQEPTSVSDAPWRLSFDIYGWLPDAPADIFIDGHEVANIPETFDNILDSLEMMAMLRFDAYKGPLNLFVSPIYYDGDYTKNFTGLLGELARRLRAASSANSVNDQYNWEHYDTDDTPWTGTFQPVIPVKLPSKAVPLMISWFIVPYTTTPKVDGPIVDVPGEGLAQLPGIDSQSARCCTSPRTTASRPNGRPSST